MFIYVGLSVVIIPILSVYVVFASDIINENATNDRNLTAIAQSGNVYGLIEMSEFGTKVDNKKMTEYLQTALNTKNFETKVFLHLPFLSQFQMITLLNSQYNVKLSNNQQQNFVSNLRFERIGKKFKFKINKNLQSFEQLLDCLYWPSVKSLCNIIVNHNFLNNDMTSLLVKYLQTSIISPMYENYKSMSCYTISQSILYWVVLTSELSDHLSIEDKKMMDDKVMHVLNYLVNIENDKYNINVNNGDDHDHDNDNYDFTENLKCQWILEYPRAIFNNADKVGVDIGHLSLETISIICQIASDDKTYGPYMF